VGQFGSGPADLTLEAGTRYLERAVVSAGFEADGLTVRKTAVFGLELTVDQPM
jgi:hypothetical protein